MLQILTERIVENSKDEMTLGWLLLHKIKKDEDEYTLKKTMMKIGAFYGLKEFYKNLIDK